MKQKCFVLAIFLLLIKNLFGQIDSSINQNELVNFKSGLISPQGISENNLFESLSGHIKYKPLDFKVKVPKYFPNKKNILYDKLLMSGLNSLLLEYKNYFGEVASSSYLIFASGNYNIFTEEMLTYINKKVFTNHSLLEKIYEWAKPFYINVFNELTYNEQNLLSNKIIIAENYIQYVLMEKDSIKFNNWISQNNIQPDDKIIGFLKRRIDKKQWTVKECSYWINKIKSDFPVLKNKNEKASHMQVINQITWNLYRACNDSGYYFLIDRFHNKQSDNYSYIECNKEENYTKLSLFKSLNNKVYNYYVSEDAVLIKPLFPEWKDWSYLNDSLVYFEKYILDTIYFPEENYSEITEYVTSGIYNRFQNKEVLNRCSLILNFSEFIIAVKKEEAKLYKQNGEMLIDEPLKLTEIENIETEGRVNIHYSYFIQPLFNNECFIIENHKNQFGVVSKDGKLLLPFHYQNISASVTENEIVVTEFEESKELIYSFSDGKFQLKN